MCPTRDFECQKQENLTFWHSNNEIVPLKEWEYVKMKLSEGLSRNMGCED
jgi:hypothetical protein